jgi:KDO2-lipid IV(A) lauroyltransferase
MHTALAGGKGVIFLSGHFGSWELIVPALRHAFDHPVTAIAQRQRNHRIDALLQVHRFRFGNSTIPMGVSARGVITALQEEKIVMVLGDQSGPKESVFIEFFGRPCATHRGAAAFSLRTGAPLVMGFLVRQRDGTYECSLEEVDRTGIEEYTEEHIVELTRRHTAILEKTISLHPDHWLWMHKRWKHTQFYESQKALQDKV